MSDVIETLAGLTGTHPVARARERRPDALAFAQRSHDLLLFPERADGFALRERRAVALYVAVLHGETAAITHYRALLEALPDVDAKFVATVLDEAAAGRTPGPYGRFPTGPLSVEDRAGPVFAVSPNGVAVLGERLSAALAHAHLLVLHPRDAVASDLGKLLVASWTTPQIVTLSQLVSFLTFQIRAAIGLRLAASAGETVSRRASLAGASS